MDSVESNIDIHVSFQKVRMMQLRDLFHTIVTLMNRQLQLYIDITNFVKSFENAKAFAGFKLIDDKIPVMQFNNISLLEN